MLAPLASLSIECEGIRTTPASPILPRPSPAIHTTRGLVLKSWFRALARLCVPAESINNIIFEFCAVFTYYLTYYYKLCAPKH